MTNCTCDTHTASSNSQVLTVTQTSTTSTALCTLYASAANGSQSYNIFSEGATNSILGKSYTNGGIGVYGQLQGGSGCGVKGEIVGGANGYGLYGSATGGTGVYGAGYSYGVYCTASSYGVYAIATNGVGVYASSYSTGVQAVSTIGLGGSFTANGNNTGLLGVTYSSTGYYFGVVGRSMGTSAGGGGVYAEGAGSGTQYSVYGNLGKMYQNGDCTIIGNLSKGGGGWRTDHPLKPETHYLNHGFVESDVMRNEYPGNVTLDSNGEALVIMPEWFPHVSSEPSVTVTAKGKRMLTGWDQIDERTFKLLGDAGGEVSYMISCKRSDQWAKKNCPGVEIEKNESEKGKYMHPEFFGPGAKHVHHDFHEEMKKQKAEHEETEKSDSTISGDK